MQKVYRTQITNVDQLKHFLLQEWSQSNHKQIAKASGIGGHRLNVCIKARGGHFEHCMREMMMMMCVTEMLLF